MFNLFPQQDETQFTWDWVGDVDRGRQNLGEQMPVFVYRLFQFTIKDELTKRCGSQAAAEILRKAGELAGKEFAAHLLDLSLPFNQFVAHWQTVLEECRIGILRLEHFDPATGDATLTLREDLDCSGLPVTGQTVCSYGEGFLAGVLKGYTKQDYVVTEVDCWATGSRVCRFEARIKDRTGHEHES